LAIGVEIAPASLRLLASGEPREDFDPWLASARAVAAEPTDLAAVARHLGRLMPASR